MLLLAALVGLVAAGVDELFLEQFGGLEFIALQKTLPLLEPPPHYLEGISDCHQKLALSRGNECWFPELALHLRAAYAGLWTYLLVYQSKPLNLEYLQGFQELRDSAFDKMRESDFAEWSGDVLRQLSWNLHVLQKKMWVLTTADAAEAVAVGPSLAPYSPAGQPGIVCIRGATHLTQESEVFSHFIWGHFFAVFVSVAEAGFLHWDTQLVFDHITFMNPLSTWLQYYLVLFNRLPRHDKTCAGATAEVLLDEHLPILSQYSELQWEEDYARPETWLRHFRHCSWRPQLHNLALQRLRASERRPGSTRIMYMGRGAVGSVGRTSETHAKREVLNVAEVVQALRTLESESVQVDHISTDLPWHQQVREFATADVVVGLHGSALGSHELWMPNGAILVSVMSPRICECRWSYCAAASEERAFLYVFATTPDSDCHHGGEWLERGRIGNFEMPNLHVPLRITDRINITHNNSLWGYTREYNSADLVRGLAAALAASSAEDRAAPLSHRFLRWALHHGHRRACGGMALQMNDDGRPADEREFSIAS